MAHSAWGRTMEAMAAPERVPEVAFTVAAVARRLGVAPATLRTWDRRYGLGPTHHHAGAHRRYSADDVARLDHMRRLVHSGISPADAAKIALNGPASAPGVPSRAGGGQVVAIPGGSPAARGLARAALGLDTTACRELVGASLADYGVVWTWERLVAPVLVGVGQRWERTGAGIDTEHVLSGAVHAALSESIARSTPRPGAGSVLLASMAEEQHDLPLWALAAGLAERGIPSRILGARTPIAALASAVRRTRPAAVLLWSQLAETGQVDAIESLPDVRPEPLILLGGPGWSGAAPSRGRLVFDLSEAIAAIARVAGP